MREHGARAPLGTLPRERPARPKRWSRARIFRDGGREPLDIVRYARLATLRFEICGAPYELVDGHRERLAKHVRMAVERVAAAYQQQREEHETSCGQGRREACLGLAEMRLHGEHGPRDVGGALALFSDQCDQGSAARCLGASTATLLLASNNEDKVPAYRAAVALAVRGCEAGGAHAGVSCWRAATLQAAGFLVPANPEATQRSAEASCRLGLRPACEQRAELSSCARGQADACMRLADAHARGPRRDNGDEVFLRIGRVPPRPPSLLPALSS